MITLLLKNHWGTVCKCYLRWAGGGGTAGASLHKESSQSLQLGFQCPPQVNPNSHLTLWFLPSLGHMDLTISQTHLALSYLWAFALVASSSGSLPSVSFKAQLTTQSPPSPRILLKDPRQNGSLSPLYSYSTQDLCIDKCPEERLTFVSATLLIDWVPGEQHRSLPHCPRQGKWSFKNEHLTRLSIRLASWLNTTVNGWASNYFLPAKMKVYWCQITCLISTWTLSMPSFVQCPVGPQK